MKRLGEDVDFKKTSVKEGKQQSCRFRHIERMGGEKLVKKIYRADLNRGRGRPRRRWMDGVKGCLSERGLIIPEAEECVKDRREWRRIIGGRRR